MKHLKHCLAKHPKLEALMGSAVRDAPDIDAPVHGRKRIKQSDSRKNEDRSLESDSSGIVGSDNDYYYR